MNNRYIIKYLMLLIVSILTSVSMADELPTVSVDRAWGLLLGDDVTVRVDLSSIEAEVAKSSLPQVNKRHGMWLYLKEIQHSAEQLDFHYQVINVPNKNTTIDSPTFDVKRSDERWLTIPSIALTIGPSIAVTEEGGISVIKAKADMSPILITTDAMKKQLSYSAVIAIISLIILSLWHFGWKTKNRQPFAQAVHDLSRLKWQRAVTADQASRILHNAFNHTANTIVVYGDIDKLLEHSSWLQPLQTEIEEFYKQSEEHFFARHAEKEPNIDDVRKLAKACRAKEMLA